MIILHLTKLHIIIISLYVSEKQYSNKNTNEVLEYRMIYD